VCVDQIAIPEFRAGAMENWGLVTYRETNLLFDERVSSPTDQQRIATVVAHELAHMVPIHTARPTSSSAMAVM